jgi:hypothetical protein
VLSHFSLSAKSAFLPGNIHCSPLKPLPELVKAIVTEHYYISVLVAIYKICWLGEVERQDFFLKAASIDKSSFSNIATDNQQEQQTSVPVETTVSLVILCQFNSKNSPNKIVGKFYINRIPFL